MSVFRINLHNVFDLAIKRGAFSLPSKTNQAYEDYNDISHWSEMETIHKGNLLLFCKGVRNIWAVGYASADCCISDVDAFQETMKYERNGFRYISFNIYKELIHPIDGLVFFEGFFTKQNPFEEEYAIMKVEPEKKYIAEFDSAINKLLGNVLK